MDAGRLAFAGRHAQAAWLVKHKWLSLLETEMQKFKELIGG